MTIILGAGKYGRWIKQAFCKDIDVLFYDNDRRMWAKKVDDTEIISLDKLLEYADNKNNRLIIGSHSDTILYFTKDINPQCPVFTVKNDKLAEINLHDIGEINYDNSQSVGEKALVEYTAQMNEFKLRGMTQAYDHAASFVEFKKKHISVPEICAIEFTNECNLKCPNCPNSFLSFHKGYMSDEVFYEILKYMPPYKNDTVSVHCMGEPLLHPKFLTYLNNMADIGINICISTNGILLNEFMSKQVLAILSRVNKATFYISFHTQKSVENWKNFLDIYNFCSNNNNISFYGQVLEHNESQAHLWLQNIGIMDYYVHPNIRHITSHSWGGNLKKREKRYSDIEVKNKIRNCYYLRNNKIIVLWDGSLKACCIDCNATQKCGNIFDFENSFINKEGYSLCRNCDPDWMTNYN